MRSAELIQTEWAGESQFPLAAGLTPKLAEELETRAVSREFALASGVRTIAGKGLQGICFPYRYPAADD